MVLSIADSGDETQVKDMGKYMSSPFIFVFMLSQFRGPGYLGGLEQATIAVVKVSVISCY